MTAEIKLHDRRPREARPSGAKAACAVLGIVAALGACRAQREIVIVTQPPGAEIRLDGTLLEQRTPARIPFTDYGVRRITLYLDGYLSYSEPFDVRPPWFARFPLDIISEVLIPVGWHDRHKLKVVLTPGDARIEAPDLAGVLQRAESMRRAGPEGPKAAERELRTMPRESGIAPEPPPPAAGGGGGQR